MGASSLEPISLMNQLCLGNEGNDKDKDKTRTREGNTVLRELQSCLSSDGVSPSFDADLSSYGVAHTGIILAVPPCFCEVHAAPRLLCINRYLRCPRTGRWRGGRSLPVVQVHHSTTALLFLL